mgnify:CR=1 FL=1
MRIWGKVLGAFFGFLLGNIFGALLGAIAWANSRLTSPDVLVQKCDGVPIAFEGHRTSCGARLLASGRALGKA